MTATITITYKPLGAIYSANLTTDLKMVGCEYAEGVTAERFNRLDEQPLDLRLGADVAVIYASADGRGFNLGGWHHGPSRDEVYVERITVDGVAFHGWVDADSHRVTQTG